MGNNTVFTLSGSSLVLQQDITGETVFDIDFMAMANRAGFADGALNFDGIDFHSCVDGDFTTSVVNGEGLTFYNNNGADSSALMYYDITGSVAEWAPYDRYQLIIELSCSAMNLDGATGDSLYFGFLNAYNYASHGGWDYTQQAVLERNTGRHASGAKSGFTLYSVLSGTPDDFTQGDTLANAAPGLVRISLDLSPATVIFTADSGVSCGSGLAGLPGPTTMPYQGSMRVGEGNNIITTNDWPYSGSMGAVVQLLNRSTNFSGSIRRLSLIRYSHLSGS